MNGQTKPGPGTTERPILFNGAMVRAILEGRKTVTRRQLKNQMANGWHIADPETPMATITSAHPKKGKFGLLIRREIYPDSGKFEHDVIVSPFGRPGDRLWVRESTEAFTSPCGAVTLARYSADHEPVTYGAELNGESFEAVAHWSYFREVCPSIHMLRTQCRILLEITDLRVERLQDITEEQALAEGAKPESCDHARQACAAIGCWGDTAKGAFGFLWETINGANSWNSNPWVWVVEFRRVTPGEAAV